jgi:acyl-CoA thioesterase FadM
MGSGLSSTKAARETRPRLGRVEGNRRFEAAFQVRFDESGPDGCLVSSGFLRYAQHAAWMHSTAEGFDRAWYAARGLTWLVRAIELRLEAAVPYGSDLAVSTEVIGFRRAWARRRSEVRLGGRLVALATIDWLLLGPTLRPARVPSEIDGAFGRPSPDVAPLRVEALEPPPGVGGRAFSVRRHELDPMAHVNNAIYLDYLEEAVEMAGGQDELARLPRAYRGEYALAAEPEARLEDAAWHLDPTTWAYRLRSDDRDAFRGRLELSPPVADAGR